MVYLPPWIFFQACADEGPNAPLSICNSFYQIPPLQGSVVPLEIGKLGRQFVGQKANGGRCIICVRQQSMAQGERLKVVGAGQYHAGMKANEGNRCRHALCCTLVRAWHLVHV